MSFDDKRVFITGIAGFIGFHLAKRLKELGCFVMGCDNFNDYYNVLLKRDRERILLKNGVHVIEKDITETGFFDDTLTKFKVTHFVHLAAQAGIRKCFENLNNYVNSNIMGVLNICESLKKVPHVKLVYASSSSVYGDHNNEFSKEMDFTDKPLSFYAATKKSNEVIVHSYHKSFGIAAIGLRYFTVYGPWGRPDMACYFFTKSIVNDENINVYNYGKMKRDFTYIDDIVAGTINALDCDSDYDVFNLGSGKSNDIMYLISLIEKKLNKKAKISLVEKYKVDVESTGADITKSQSKLGYAPKIDLKEGMSRFIDWYLCNCEF